MINEDMFIKKVDFPVLTLRKQTSINPLLQKLYLLSMIQRELTP